MRRGIVGAVVLALLAAACSDDGESSGDGAAEAAAVVSGEWEVVDPEDRDMDAATLERARAYAFDEVEHTQGVVVVRGGAIVAEWYDDGADAVSYAASWSMAKSFTSALVGIAIDEGLIPSVDELMTTYYPEWEGTPREEITLRDVLQMASGLDYTESYDPADIETSDIIQLVLFQPDQLAYAASRPLAEPPGSVFNYSSGDTLVLSGMLEQVTGMSAADYAEEKLFGPIGIEGAEWWEDAAGHTLTYCCLDTTTRDFARFGQLYLDGGSWGDRQVVPEDWVRASLEPSPTAAFYGYQWWLVDDPEADGLPADTFSARGLDGQSIYVIPSLDLVVVRNGTYIKWDGEPVADPNLYTRYPNDLVPDLGTRAPDPSWDVAAFLGPIIESIGTPD